METDRLKLKQKVHKELGKVGTAIGGRILIERVSAAHTRGQSATNVVKDPKVQKIVKNMTKWNSGK